MKVLCRIGFGLELLASTALLSACAGGVPNGLAPPGARDTVDLAKQTRLADNGTWMLPEAKTDDLLYVGGNNDELTVYSYPQGKLVGVVKNPNFFLLSGECVDATGDIFVTSLGNAKVFEYQHGGKKPIATLQAASDDPVGCSIDPTSGDLAVTTLGYSKLGNVAVYRHARGTPKTYRYRPIYRYFFCGYDDEGNLYVDGTMKSPEYFQFAELPKGARSLKTINLNQKIDWPGSVQANGQYVAIGDQAVPNVYDFSISGSQGTLTRTTPINGVLEDSAFWIEGRRVIVADGSGSYQSARIFDYPGGGDPIKVIRRGVAGPHGTVVSRATKPS